MNRHCSATRCGEVLDEKSPSEVVRNIMQEENGYSPVLWHEMAQLGWPALAIDPEFDGVGLTLGRYTKIPD